MFVVLLVFLVLLVFMVFVVLLVLLVLVVLVVFPRSIEMLSRSMVSWEGRAVDASTGLAGVLASISNISLRFSPVLAIISNY